MQPRKGMRFYHSRVLDASKWDGKTPQMYEVTRVANGCVYYRAVIDYGTREALGSCECCLLENFPKVVKSPID